MLVFCNQEYRPATLKWSQSCHCGGTARTSHTSNPGMLGQGKTTCG